MTTSVESITQAAAGLSPLQKLTLANHLLAGVDQADQATVDAAWTEVILERRARYLAGKAETFSAEETFAEAKRQLKAMS